jgi:hypothetical protein
VFGLTFENIDRVPLSRCFDDIGERAALMMQINVFYLIKSEIVEIMEHPCR